MTPKQIENEKLRKGIPRPKSAGVKKLFESIVTLCALAIVVIAVGISVIGVIEEQKDAEHVAVAMYVITMGLCLYGGTALGRSTDPKLAKIGDRALLWVGVPMVGLMFIARIILYADKIVAGIGAALVVILLAIYYLGVAIATIPPTVIVIILLFLIVIILYQIKRRMK